MIEDVRNSVVTFVENLCLWKRGGVWENTEQDFVSRITLISVLSGKRTDPGESSTSL